MNGDIKLSTSKKLQLIALVIAACALKCVAWILGVLCGSAAGGLLAGLVVAVGIFAFICSKGHGPMIDHFQPASLLYRLTPINALAVVKNALMSKHFDDKQWRNENVDADTGTALFVCKYMDKQNEKTIVERKIQLTVSVCRLNDGVTVCFVYEPVNIGPLERIPPAELCARTTAFLEEQLSEAERVVFR